MYDESAEEVESESQEDEPDHRTTPPTESTAKPKSSDSIIHVTSSLTPTRKPSSGHVTMKEDPEPKSNIKKELSSGSLEPMDSLKTKPLENKTGQSKKSDRPGQDQSDDEEDDEDEESEYQRNSRLAQIEGRRKVDAFRANFGKEFRDEEDYNDESINSDLDEEELAKLSYDEFKHYMALKTLVQNSADRGLGLVTPIPVTHPCFSPTIATPLIGVPTDEELEQMRQKLHESDLEVKRDEIRLVAKFTSKPGVHQKGCWMYNADDYEHLNTTSEIKELFEYITMYSPPPTSSQVDVKLKPFIPEFYPSVGDIDAFLKVIHPEISNDNLGIKVLDEPCAFQSDPSVLDLRLRAMAKQSSAKAVVVKKVENVGKNSKVIDNWIKDISDLHRSKPSPSIHYSKPMPDIDLLLQEWPPGFENLLATTKLPPPDIDCDLKTYIDIVCNILDIPVYKSRIQSLHVLASLFLAHKSFGNYAIGGGTSGKRKKDNSGLMREDAGIHENGVDRLELE